MARLAVGRKTHLTPEEIAAEALRQFDAGPDEPSVRSLAQELNVAPTAIYHHYPSVAAIHQAAVELVWNEAIAETLMIVPAPLEADARDVLVATGLGTRRAWLRHFRLAPHMAATPEASEFTANALGLMSSIFERLELEPDAAAASFHSYSSFMIGAVLFAAERKIANEQLVEIPSHRRAPADDPTRASIDEVMDLSVTDPVRDEELFEQGLRRLVEGF